MIKFWALLVSGVALSLFIRIYLILNGSEVADIHTLKEMGELALNGTNPYLALNYNAYPPLALLIEEATIKLSQFITQPFFILIKIWPNLADIGISLLIYLFLSKQGVEKMTAVFFALAFFLNPISIIISAAHGQIDSIPTFLVVLSIFLLTFKLFKYQLFFSAFSFGIAIAIKANPLILLPLFLLYVFRKNGLIAAVLFLLITFLPISVLFLPYLQDNGSYTLEKLFGYSGSNDFGIPAVLRWIHFQQNGELLLSLNSDLIQLSKYFFLAFMAIVIFLFRKSGKLIEGCLIAYLSFITFYFGISAQYLSWVLPFAVLLKDKMIFIFTVSGFAAILGFYLYFNPTIVIVQLSQILPYQKQFMSVYFLGNLLFWIVTFVWLVKRIRVEVKIN